MMATDAKDNETVTVDEKANMIEFQLGTCDIFKKLTEIFKEMFPDASLIFDKDTVQINQSDKFGLVRAYIQFDRMGDNYIYNIDDDDDYDEDAVSAVGVDFADLAPIIKKFPSKEPFRFYYTADNQYCVEWSDQTRRTTFTYNAIETGEYAEDEYVEQPYNLRIKMPSSSLKDVCDEMQVSKTKTLRIVVSNNKIYFFSGDNEGLCKVRSVKDITVSAEEADSGFEFDATFLLNRILPLVKSSLSSEIELRFCLDKKNGDKKIELRQPFDVGMAIFVIGAKKNADEMVI